MPDSFDGFCSIWPEADSVGRMRVCIHPTAIFKNVFDVYNFSIILNFFDSNKPHALTFLLLKPRITHGILKSSQI